jgi:hypothetical protein
MTGEKIRAKRSCHQQVTNRTMNRAALTASIYIARHTCVVNEAARSLDQRFLSFCRGDEIPFAGQPFRNLRR